MATPERASGPWWQPTWRRLIASTVVLFAVILAFLVGRVRSGADPALAGSTARPAQQAPARSNGNTFDPQNQGVVPQGQGVDPNDPSADPQGRGADPPPAPPSPAGGPASCGNGTPGAGRGSGPRGAAPPSTHVS